MKISTHCYALTGLSFIPPWSVNAGFITGSKRTLVVDTGANTLAAQTIYGYAQATNSTNEVLVVNTERHLDHVAGNGYFAEQGCCIYGHHGIQRVPEDLIIAMEEFNSLIPQVVRQKAREEKAFFRDTKIVNPDHPIREITQLDLGNFSVSLIPTPGHTTTNITVHVPIDNVLFVGDCLVSDYLPNLEEGEPTLWQSWLQSLATIEALKPQIVVPGHGQVLQGEAITIEIDRTRTIIQNAIQAGKAPTLWLQNI